MHHIQFKYWKHRQVTIFVNFHISFHLATMEQLLVLIVWNGVWIFVCYTKLAMDVLNILFDVNFHSKCDRITDVRNMTDIRS